MFVLIEEDERSINDGFFISDPPNPTTGKSLVWYDFPANSARRHHFTYTMNFADGHSEIWRYRDPQSARIKANHAEQPGNTDLARIGRAASLLK